MSYLKPKDKYIDKSNYFIIGIFAVILALSIGYIGNGLYARVFNSADKKMPNDVQLYYVNSEDLKERMVENPEIILLDVRAKDDYEWEHIKEAENIPLNEITTEFNTYSKTTEIVTFCDSSSCEYSKIAARRLTKAGYNNVKVLYEGLTGLKSVGFKIIKAEENEIIENAISIRPIEESEVINLLGQSALIYIVDIRTESKYNDNHYDTAVWYDKKDLINKVNELPVERNIILVTENDDDAQTYGQMIVDEGFIGVSYIVK